LRTARCISPLQSQRDSYSQPGVLPAATRQASRRSGPGRNAPEDLGFSRETGANYLYYTDVSKAGGAARRAEPMLPRGAPLPMLAAFPLAASFAQLDNYVAKNVLLRQNSPRQNWSPNDHLCRQKCEFATKLPATKPTARAGGNSLQPTAFSPPPTPSAIRHSSFGIQSFPGASHSSYSWFTPPLPPFPLSCSFPSFVVHPPRRAEGAR
jgi:hypothetical protein